MISLSVLNSSVRTCQSFSKQIKDFTNVLWENIRLLFLTKLAHQRTASENLVKNYIALRQTYAFGQPASEKNRYSIA